MMPKTGSQSAFQMTSASPPEDDVSIADRVLADRDNDAYAATF